MDTESGIAQGKSQKLCLPIICFSVVPLVMKEYHFLFKTNTCLNHMDMSKHLPYSREMEMDFSSKEETTNQ